MSESPNKPIQEPTGEDVVQYKTPESIEQQATELQNDEAQSAEINDVSQPTAENTEILPPPAKKKKLKKVLIPAAVVAFLAIVGVVVYFLFFSTGNLYEYTANSIKASLRNFTAKETSEIIEKSVKEGSVQLSVNGEEGTDLSAEAFFSSNGFYLDANGKTSGMDIGTIKAFFTKKDAAVIASNFLGKDGIGISFENFDEMFDASIFGEKSGSNYKVDEETAEVIKDVVASLIKTDDSFSIKEIIEKNSSVEKSSTKIMTGGVDNVSATAVTITLSKENLLEIAKEIAEKTGTATDKIESSFDMVPANFTATVTTYINGAREAMRLEAYFEINGIKPLKLIADFGENPDYYTKATISVNAMGTQLFTLERSAVSEGTFSTVTFKMTAGTESATMKFTYDKSNGEISLSSDANGENMVIKGTMAIKDKTVTIVLNDDESGAQLQLTINAQKGFPEKFEYKDILKMSEEDVENLQAIIVAYSSLAYTLQGPDSFGYDI